MLDINFNRRDFLRVGGIGAGLGCVPFSDIAFAENEIVPPSQKSVVWVWLGGGPTQFETFHAPTGPAPDTHKPVSGMVNHSNIRGTELLCRPCLGLTILAMVCPPT